MASVGTASDAMDVAQEVAVDNAVQEVESSVKEPSNDAVVAGEDAVNVEKSVDDVDDQETSSELSDHAHEAAEDAEDAEILQEGEVYEHNDDEYDPANPSHEDEGYEYDPADPAEAVQSQEGEYDPENPGDGFTNGSEPHADASESGEKRKASSSVASSPSPSVASVSRSPKRQRTGEARATHKPDQRGLSDAVWDRLLDFELSGQFRVAQVSRASFASIAALPEFAQAAIVARFARTPMKDIRDKNALIMRLYREYLAENPLVEKLQPASAVVDNAASDPGLYEFGYAPPMPRTGMSTTKIPSRTDKPGTFTTTSALPQLTVKPKVAAGGQQELDEFGRVVKNVKTEEGVQQPTAEPKSDPSAAASTNVVNEPIDAQTKAIHAAAGKPLDPRRRRNEGPPADPVRPSPSAGTGSEASARRIEKSDVYNRLLPSVRARLDALISANRLPEAINDNVLSRLNHLPEPTALVAVDKFAEADLGLVSNLNGFLVGIINRVQDRGAPQSDPRGPSPSHATGPPGGAYRAPAGHPSHQQPQLPQYHRSQQQPHHHVSTQHQPYGAVVSHERQPTHVPLARPHHAEHYGGHFRDTQMPPPQAHTPVAAPSPQVGYERHYAPAHAPAPVVWQPPQNATDPRRHYQHQETGAPTGGRFSTHPTIDRAVSSLPVSVQNHLVSLVNSKNLPSLDDLSEKCYETLGQLSEGLAIDVLTRFGAANLSTVRNRSGFLMGVVKNCRQEYGFD